MLSRLCFIPSPSRCVLSRHPIIDCIQNHQYERHVVYLGIFRGPLNLELLRLQPQHDVARPFVRKCIDKRAIGQIVPKSDMHLMPQYVLSPCQISQRANAPRPLLATVWSVRIAGAKLPGTVVSILGALPILRGTGPSNIVLLDVIATVPIPLHDCFATVPSYTWFH